MLQQYQASTAAVHVPERCWGGAGVVHQGGARVVPGCHRCGETRVAPPLTLQRNKGGTTVDTAVVPREGRHRPKRAQRHVEEQPLRSQHGERCGKPEVPEPLGDLGGPADVGAVLGKADGLAVKVAGRSVPSRMACGCGCACGRRVRVWA